MDKPKILTAKELRAIMPRLAGWKLARNKLTRTFELTRYDMGGKVTDRDVEVAKKISSEYRTRA